MIERAEVPGYSEISLREGFELPTKELLNAVTATESP